MRYFILTILILLFSLELFAQRTNNSKKQSVKTESKLEEKKVLGFAPDSVFVLIKGENRFIRHKVKKGETVYSISKFYNIEFDQLKKYNPDLAQNTLKENQYLILPINPKAIIVQKPKDFKEDKHLKLYYSVLPKETMYTIAKGYFRLSVEELQERNKLQKTDLSVGQSLHIGWLPKSGIPDSLNKLPWLSYQLAEENKKLRKKYENVLAEGKKETKQEGKAVWPKDKQMSSGNSLYVLHSDAAQGSVVRIENPMTERVIYAKVIGKVPDTEFAKGSIAMLSTTVAKVLGILDSTAFIKIQYLSE
jgi:LysM repeat protein